MRFYYKIHFVALSLHKTSKPISNYENIRDRDHHTIYYTLKSNTCANGNWIIFRLTKTLEIRTIIQSTTPWNLILAPMAIALSTRANRQPRTASCGSMMSVLQNRLKTSSGRKDLVEPGSVVVLTYFGPLSGWCSLLQTEWKQISFRSAIMIWPHGTSTESSRNHCATSNPRRLWCYLFKYCVCLCAFYSLERAPLSFRRGMPIRCIPFDPAQAERDRNIQIVQHLCRDEMG